MWEYNYIDSDELYHHGIMGQKWGVRRYQNDDGSLTPAGVKRYGTVSNYKKVQAAKAKVILAKKTARADKEAKKYLKKIKSPKDDNESSGKTKEAKPQSKKISEMTDDEIRAKINRINLERQLAALTPQQESKGKKLVSTLKDIAVPALKEAGKKQLTEYLNKQLGDALGNNVKSEKERLQKEVDILRLKVEKKEKLDVLSGNKKESKTLKDMLDAYEKDPNALTIDQIKDLNNALDNHKKLSEAMDKSNRGKDRLQKEVDMLDLKVKKKEKQDILKGNNKTDKTIKDMLDAYEKNPDAFTFDQLKELNIALANRKGILEKR